MKPLRGLELDMSSVEDIKPLRRLYVWERALVVWYLVEDIKPLRRLNGFPSIRSAYGEIVEDTKPLRRLKPSLDYALPPPG
jgi:hypothetical protein